MGSIDDHPDPGTPAREEPGAAPTPPLVAFAHRHRLLIGLAVGAVMAVFFVWSIVGVPQATVPGAFGVVQRYAFPLMCVLIGAVGITWGLRLRGVWTNVAAYGAILTYVVYLVVGWVYENFVAA